MSLTLVPDKANFAVKYNCKSGWKTFHCCCTKSNLHCRRGCSCSMSEQTCIKEPFLVSHSIKHLCTYDYSLSIILIAVFCVPVCVCVCLTVCNFGISEMGSHNATLLATMWRASLSELQWLLLELTQLTANPWNHALHVKTVQYLRNWSSSWKRVRFFPSTGMQPGRRAFLQCGKLY